VHHRHLDASSAGRRLDRLRGVLEREAVGHHVGDVGAAGLDEPEGDHVVRATRAGARLDGDYSGRVRFAPSAREGAVAVWVGGYEPGSFVVPDRIEGDLQLVVIEGAVVASYDDVYLLRSFSSLR
jgi:hypothetical protein